MTQFAIDTRGLTKRYGSVGAVRALNLQVPAGSICGLLGRNGAGKTTTLKMLVGLTRPNAGEGFVLGRRIDDEDGSVSIRRRTAFVSEDKDLPAHLDVAGAIRFTSAFFPTWNPEMARRAAEAFGLPEREGIGRLSKGMRCRLVLTLALARGAELLLLDEPTDGLDPAAIETFLQLLVGLAADGGVTVLLSSHRLAEVEQIADRIAVLHEGQLVLNDSVEALQSSYRRLHLVFDAEVPAPALALARAHAGQSDGRTVSLFVSGDLDPIVAQARAWQPRAIDVHPVTLKEIFLETTKGSTS